MEAADDHAAAVVLPVYEVYRAVVRAAVATLRGVDPTAERAETDRYLELATRLTRPRRPVLLVTCGISGCGKTTLAGRIVAATGGVRLRSDVERKRLAGMRPADRPADRAATAAIYGPEATRRVYRRLADLTGTLLDAGSSVVVDAACLKHWQRGELAAVARDRQVPLVWLEIDVPLETALARVAAREAAGGDASDATPDVVQGQWDAREPFTDHELAAAGGNAPRHVRVHEADLADPDFAARLSRGLPSGP
jgi:predicted kinase